MVQHAIRIRSRAHIFSALVGLIAGLLLAGIAVPFIFGSTTPLYRTSSVSSGVPGASFGHSQGAQAAATTPAGTGVSGGPAAAATASGAPAADASGSVGGTGAVASPSGGLPGSTAKGSPVKIGFLLFDIGGVTGVGVSVPNFDPKQQQAVYQVFVDHLNHQGGLAGHPIVPVYRVYNILDQNDMEAACLSLTEDSKVFAVLDPVGAFYGPPVSCVTQQHHVPFISMGSTAFTDEMYTDAAGLLFTVLEKGSRILANDVYLMNQEGRLRGRTLGVVDDSRPGDHETVEAGVVGTLSRLGYRVSYTATLAPDNQTAASQIPVEVEKMREAGVNTIFLAVGQLNGTQWVQTADNQLYRPQYLTSDWFNGNGDTYAQNMPSSFEGSLSVTVTRTGEWRVGLPEPAIDAGCRQIYQQATGQTIKPADTAYGLTMGACNTVNLLQAGASHDGGSLDAETLSHGIQEIGRMALASTSPGSFGPGKFDGADEVRTLMWHAGCKCWEPSGSFVPAPVTS